MDTFTEAIRAAPVQAELARDCGVKPAAVTGWINRDEVHSRYWRRLLSHLAKHGIRLEYADLARWAERGELKHRPQRKAS